MKRFVIAVAGRAYIGVSGWEWYPVLTTKQAYKFTSKRGADNFAATRFQDYVVVEVRT